MYIYRNYSFFGLATSKGSVVVYILLGDMPGDSVKVAVRVRPFNQVIRFFFSVFFFSISIQFYNSRHAVSFLSPPPFSKIKKKTDF